MKKQTFHLGLLSEKIFCLVILFSFLSFNRVIAQKIISNNLSQTQIEKSANNASQPLLQSKKESNIISEGTHSTTKNNGVNPVPFTTCGDLGVENNSWGSWIAEEGYHPTGSVPIFFAPMAAPISPRFNIVTSAGNDPCSVGAGATGPAVPVVAPGFGNFSIQLGQPRTDGLVECTSKPPYPGPVGGSSGNGCSERLHCPFTVTAQDTNFIYAYAIFVENPDITNNPHTAIDAPFAEIYILAPNSSGGVDTVPCSHRRYTSSLTSSTTPGFYKASCKNQPSPDFVSYKPWTTVGVNLAPYVAKTLTVVITNSDCGKGGHFCHSYWDFACPPLTGSVNPFCLGQPTTISGPASDPGNPYTYTWYQNNNLYTGPPVSPTSTITPTPAAGDIFSVHVLQPSGCGFWMSFSPPLLTLNADFTLTNNCGVVSFTDGSTSSSAGAINSWNWSFPGANPPSANIANPGVTYTTTGTHTVTLTVTSTLGCTGTKVLTVTTANPVAAFSTGPVCLGTNTTFTDNSSASTGDPLSTWDWNFGDGTTNSPAQSPTHVYATAGTYTVTQIVSTLAGCKDTITKIVIVNAIPVAAFSSSTVCAGNQTQLTDSSTPSGSITWSWALPGGNPVSSTSQNPFVSYPSGGTYTATLTVTTPGGCKNMISMPVYVKALPVADFSSTPVCVGDATTLTDHSTPPSTGGTVNNWSWNFQNGNPAISNTQNPTVTFPVGTNNATFVVTASNGCISSVVHPVIVRGLPVPGFNSNSPCMGDATNLFNGSVPASPSDPITSWNWSMPGGAPAASSDSFASTFYSTPGTHSVTLTVTTQYGCTKTFTDTVRVFPPPIANFIGFGNGCAPLCITNYNDHSITIPGNNIVTWQWSFPGGDPSTSTVANPPSVCYNTPGSYGASLTITTLNGCKDDTTITPLVTAYGWPTAEFCIKTNPMPTTDPVFNFCDQWSTDVVQWVWTFGDGDSNNVDINPVHSYSATATANDFYSYNVCLNVQNQNGCWDHICHTVDLLPEFEFYIPNCFTPNSDYNNETFFGKCRGVKDYNIWVFDRWGNQVWDCHYTGKNTDFDMPGSDGMASTCKWDGKVVKGGMDMSGGSGQTAQEDVYVWKVKLTDIFDKTHNYIGHVSIVK